MFILSPFYLFAVLVFRMADLQIYCRTIDHRCYLALIFDTIRLERSSRDGGFRKNYLVTFPRRARILNIEVAVLRKELFDQLCLGKYPIL